MDEVLALAEDWRKAIKDPQEYAMLEFSEKVAGDAYKIMEKDIQNLRDVGFSDVEILEIVSAASYRVLISKFADALGLKLSDHYIKKSPELVEALSLGRPALMDQEGQ
ncbi:MAG: hypothetical protein QF745_04710 [Planctomycetota bacterium]|nr:hypothetical protein [Planctomycetota bacterium]